MVHLVMYTHSSCPPSLFCRTLTPSFCPCTCPSPYSTLPIPYSLLSTPYSLLPLPNLLPPVML